MSTSYLLYLWKDDREGGREITIFSLLFIPFMLNKILPSLLFMNPFCSDDLACAYIMNMYGIAHFVF